MAITFLGTRFPVTLWLHSDIPREYIEAFYRGAQMWEDEFNRNFFDFKNYQEKAFDTFLAVLSYLLFK